MLRVARRLKAEVVLDSLVEIFRTRGVPTHIRSDNGPEFVAHAIQRWLANVDVETLYIEPASPWENGYAESFFSRLRDELMNCEVFTTLVEAEALGRAWKIDYNDVRPHSSLGYRTPAEFAATCAASVRATAAPSPSLPQHTLDPVLS